MITYYRFTKPIIYSCEVFILLLLILLLQLLTLLSNEKIDIYESSWVWIYKYIKSFKYIIVNQWNMYSDIWNDIDSFNRVDIKKIWKNEDILKSYLYNCGKIYVLFIIKYTEIKSIIDYF